MIFFINIFGCSNPPCAHAARRLPAHAPRACSSRPNVTETRSTGRPERTGARLRAIEATRPAEDRRGAPGSVLRLSSPPHLAQTRPSACFPRFAYWRRRTHGPGAQKERKRDIRDTAGRSRVRRSVCAPVQSRDHASAPRVRTGFPVNAAKQQRPPALALSLATRKMLANLRSHEVIRQ